MESGMTMVYKARDAAMLTAVKPGNKIKFDAEQVNGQYTVTKIEKSK
jgi:Cu(I)/Ag(I) efflux system periplasmic protein CusF